MPDHQFLESFCKFSILAFQAKKELDICEDEVAKYQLALEVCLQQEDGVRYLVQDELVHSPLSDLQTAYDSRRLLRRDLDHRLEVAIGYYEKLDEELQQIVSAYFTGEEYVYIKEMIGSK